MNSEEILAADWRIQRQKHPLDSSKIRIALRNAIIQRVDCDRICEFARLLGITLSAVEAEKIWEHWSHDRDAGWLVVDKIEQVAEALEWFVDHYTGLEFFTSDYQKPK